MSDMQDFLKKLNKLGRFGGYGSLKTWILYTLNERPRNGAEIMDAIEMMSYGAWRPSPGSIYPMLTKMVEENLIRKRDDGRYEAVNPEFDEFGMFGARSGSSSIGSILAEMDNYLSYMEDLQKEKVQPYEEKLDRIIERLKRLKASLHN